MTLALANAIARKISTLTMHPAPLIEFPILMMEFPSLVMKYQGADSRLARSCPEIDISLIISQISFWWICLGVPYVFLWELWELWEME